MRDRLQQDSLTASSKIIWILLALLIIVATYWIYTNYLVTKVLVEVSNIEFPEAVHPAEEAMFRADVDNKDSVAHSVTMFFNTSTTDLQFYVGDKLLQHNATSWWYTKEIDPRGGVKVAIIVKGTLPEGYSSVSIGMVFDFAVDGKVLPDRKIVQTIRIEKP